MKKSRWLALDYGHKRIGVSVSDVEGIIALPLEVIANKEIFTFLQAYLEKEELRGIIFGMPYHLDGSSSAMGEEIKKVSQKVHNQFPKIPLFYYDERFTSSIAESSLYSSNLSKKKRNQKHRIDLASATLILQSFISFYEIGGASPLKFS